MSRINVSSFKLSKFNFKKPISLTLRVTLFVGLVITICIIFLSWLVQSSINNHFVQQDIEELQVVSREVKQSLTNSQSKPNNFDDSFEDAISGHHSVSLLVADQNKNVLYESKGPKLTQLLYELTPVNELSSDKLYTWQENGITYHGALVQQINQQNKNHSTESDSYFIVVAASTSFHLNYLKQFKTNSWLISLAALLITFIAAWFAVWHGHKPLRKISQQLKSISSNRLNFRLDTSTYPNELLDLAKELNLMLARIEASYLRLSHFSADIAHELRTPVSNLMMQTQVALNKSRDPESYREILYSNLEEYERLALMISDMLFLAKSDNGLVGFTPMKMELDHEVLALFDYFDALASERDLKLILQSSSPKILADKAMLRRALSNLYSNAIRFTAAGKSISTTITESKGWVKICIENPGEIIPEQHIERLFDRFYRADFARKYGGDGAGLGLAITRSIIECHQGSISVESDEICTRFSILIPSVSST